MAYHGPKSRRLATGFTLIELLAATVLAVILMFAVLKVTASINRSTQTSATPSASSNADSGTQLATWRSDLTQVMTDDFQTARHVNVENHQLVIEGLDDINDRRGTRTHLPTIVRYQLIHKRTTGLLIREQDNLLDAESHSRSATLIAAGVKLFHAELLYASAKGLTPAPTPTRARTPNPTAAAKRRAGQGTKSHPVAIRVRIVFKDPHQPPIRKTFWLDR